MFWNLIKMGHLFSSTGGLHDLERQHGYYHDLLSFQRRLLLERLRCPLTEGKSSSSFGADLEDLTPTDHRHKYHHS